MSALLIDIGNSRIKWRLVDVDAHGRDEDAARAAATDVPWVGPEHVLAVTEVDRIADAWVAMSWHPVVEVYISNVASPEREAAVIRAAERTWVGASIRSVHSCAVQCGVVNGYHDPTQLGTDRWMALIGAHASRPDRALLVCCFGTATTIDLLVPEGGAVPRAAFVGGMILPGIEAMRCALPSTTARLPLASGEVLSFANATDDAIASGIVAAQAGAVERSVRLARERFHTVFERHPLTCLLAGGAAIAIAPFLAGADFRVERVHDLVLRGLAAIARTGTP